MGRYLAPVHTNINQLKTLSMILEVPIDYLVCNDAFTNSDAEHWMKRAFFAFDAKVRSNQMDLERKLSIMDQLDRRP